MRTDDLDPRLTAILVAIVRAYHAPGDRSRERLMHLRLGGMRELVKHHAWPAEAPEVKREDLEQLEERGLVRIDRLERSWTFAPSVEGTNLAARHISESALAPRRQGIDSSWSAVRPVLYALLDAWDRAGASPGGIPLEPVAEELQLEPHDPQLLSSLELLAQDEWIEAVYELGRAGPIAVRPLPKAFAGARGWPGGDDEAATERLIAVIEQLAARESNEVQRTKLAQLREFLLELSPRLLAELVARLAGAA